MSSGVRSVGCATRVSRAAAADRLREAPTRAPARSPNGRRNGRARTGAGEKREGIYTLPGGLTLEPVWVDLGLAVVVAAGVALRFWTTSALWLDEALSVNIASLPIERIDDALAHDGAPPLYYVLLHGWMAIFGATDMAVRSFSGVGSVAALPLMWLAGRRLCGREGGWVALAMMATSPFAMRYATETRMYTLVVVIVAAGFLALSSFFERPTTLRLAALMASSAALVLTHYWGLFLIGAVLIALAVHADGNKRRAPSSWAMVGVATGALALLPWLPLLIEQALHTGTPWADPPRLSSIFFMLLSFGGEGEVALFVGLLLLGLAAIGAFGRRFDNRRVLLDVRGASPGRGLALVTLATLAMAVGAGLVTQSGFAPRYASVVLVPFLLLATVGVLAIASPRGRRIAVAVLATLSLGAAVQSAGNPRTQADKLASVLNERGRAQDLVVYCPDQLGPAVHRELDAPIRELTFPRYGDPKLVDWVDYAESVEKTDPAEFARRVHALAGLRPVWLVWSPGYKGLGRTCELVDLHLSNIRPSRRTFVRLDYATGPEHAELTRYSVDGFPTPGGPRGDDRLRPPSRPARRR